MLIPPREPSRLGMAACLLPLLLAACGRPAVETGGDPLLVLAASDLQYALPEIATHYQREKGREVRFVLGSTGNLASQIEQGAPADLFLSANERFVDRLEERGLTVAETRRTYAVGRLAIVWAPGVPPLETVSELGEGDYSAVAIANPEHAPYGLAARQTLEAMGVWEALEGRLVLAENIAQAHHFVRSGNADVGLVALGVVIGVPGTEHLVVPDDLHLPLRQTGVVLAASVDRDAAGDFLDYLVGSAGQRVLRRYGFESAGW
jgi:molybdate transport system substrate-binding protein